MDSDLGNKIKNLRKELKMTQSQLAEPEMTKSMLSQIENGLAMPSMKNLQFIAKKLSKPLSFFFDDSSQNVNKESFDEIVIELKNIDDLIKNKNYKKALSCIDILQSKISLNSNDRLMGDILYRKGKCLMCMDALDEGEKFLKEAYDIYLKSNNYTEAAKSYSEIAIKPWRNFDYEECIRIHSKAMKIYDKSPNRDTHFEIELSNDLAAFYSAKGDLEKSLEYLKNALDISNTTGIYYKADEIHRLTAGLSFIQGDDESYRVNIEKAEQFAKFTNNKEIMQYIFSVKAVYENERGNYEKALEYLEEMAKYITSKEQYFYCREKAKALFYLGSFEEALENIKLVDYPDYVNHRFDYLIMWSAKIYEGLIYNHFGQLDKALESINTGIEKMKKFGSSKLLSFALESLSDIYYKMEQFEKAYEYLKQAKDMKDFVVKNKIYF